jgi:hypothetical protein
MVIMVESMSATSSFFSRAAWRCTMTSIAPGSAHSLRFAGEEDVGRLAGFENGAAGHVRARRSHAIPRLVNIPLPERGLSD